MRIFYPDKWSLRITAHIIFINFGKTGIHPPDYICVWFFKMLPSFCSFILHRTRFIPVFNPMIIIYKSRSITGFITHRPNNHRRMIFIALYHTLNSIMMHFCEFRFIGRGFIFVITKTVTFYICLINYIQTVFIT